MRKKTWAGLSLAGVLLAGAAVMILVSPGGKGPTKDTTYEGRDPKTGSTFRTRLSHPANTQPPGKIFTYQVGRDQSPKQIALTPVK